MGSAARDRELIKEQESGAGGQMEGGVTRSHDVKSTNTCQPDVALCTPTCLHRPLTCTNKPVRAPGGRRLFLWDGDEVSLCVPLRFHPLLPTELSDDGEPHGRLLAASGD